MEIWKYELALGPDSVFDVKMPKGAQVLCVQNQGGDIFLWAKVDPEGERERRKFAIYGTGNPVPANGTYIGTVQQGPFEWHVFEEVD